MVCSRCAGPLGSAGSLVCLACSAVETITKELRSPWPSASVKAIATDQLVSTARQVRALRLTTCRFYTETAGVEPGEPLPWTEARQRARDELLGEESRLREDAKKEGGESTHASKVTLTKAESPSSYSYTESPEDKTAGQAGEEAVGATAKAKTVPRTGGRKSCPKEAAVEEEEPSRRRRRSRSSRRVSRKDREALPRRVHASSAPRRASEAESGTKPGEYLEGHLLRGGQSSNLYLHDRHLVLHDEREAARPSRRQKHRWQQRQR